MNRIIWSAFLLGILSFMIFDLTEAEIGFAQEAGSLIVTTDRLEYKHGDTVRYEVKNRSSKDIYIMKGQHNLNFIELQDSDGLWKRYGLTMFPEEPPRPGDDPYEKISPESKITYDRWLGWLFNINDYQQFEFIPGNYRLIIEYKLSKEDDEFLEAKSNEFRISIEDSQNEKQHLSPWTKKAPYPYENQDGLLVKNSYKEEWVESSTQKYPEAIQRAKEVLSEWGQSPDKYEYNSSSYDYKILVSESPNFISIVFYPVGLAERLERHVEIRMTKNDYVILSILPGS